MMLSIQIFLTAVLVSAVSWWGWRECRFANYKAAASFLAVVYLGAFATMTIAGIVAIWTWGMS